MILRSHGFGEIYARIENAQPGLGPCALSDNTLVTRACALPVIARPGSKKILGHCLAVAA